MHPEAYRFVERHATSEPVAVLEVGSLDVNGSIRHLFPNATVYHGLNDVPGEGVDIVADAATWEPEREYDIVVSTEVLEHAEQWKLIVATCRKALRVGGKLILTCAGVGRMPHGQWGAADPAPGEWYRNVADWELASELWWADGYVGHEGNDTQACVAKVV